MTPRTVLATSRAMIGLGAWLAPDTTVALFGLDPDRSNRFVGRLFGARELALALSLLAAPGPALGGVAMVGAAVDSIDAVAGFDERRRGNLGTRATLLGPVGAVGFAALGVLVARRAQRSAA
jgi:hypothetical protein